MDVYQAVISRRSIRRFRNAGVPYDILEKCVNAARLAPSGRNNQVCEYIIVDDEQVLPKVFNAITIWAGEARPKGGAPPGYRPRAYIIILINAKLETELGRSRRVATYDVGMAAENIVLVALEEGIGTCPILSFDEDQLKQVLNLPETHNIALLIALGYPDEHPVEETATESIKYWTDSQGVRHVPKRKLEDITHRNKFP